MIKFIKNLFRKRKAVSISETDKDNLKDDVFKYRVTISDPLGSTSRAIRQFYCSKKRDDQGIVWLINEKEEFKEPFPLDYHEESEYTPEQIEEKIKKLELKKTDKTQNPLSTEKEIFLLKRLLNVAKLPKSSYLKFDIDGLPHIEYIRFRNDLIPLKYNIEFSTVHVPHEDLSQDILTKFKEKREKYEQARQGMFTFGMMVFFIVNLIFLGILIYWSYGVYDQTNESAVAQLQNRIDNTAIYCAEMYGQAGQNFKEASQYSVNITKLMFDTFNPRVSRDIDLEVIE